MANGLLFHFEVELGSTQQQSFLVTHTERRVAIDAELASEVVGRFVTNSCDFAKNDHPIALFNFFLLKWRIVVVSRYVISWDDLGGVGVGGECEGKCGCEGS